MKKRILSIFLAVTLGVSGLGGISYAQNEAEQEAVVKEEQKEENTVSEVEWKLQSMEFDKKSPQQLSESVNISADVENPRDDLQYKFVWMKNNWNNWDVIQEFSRESSVKWQPESSGAYTLYVNVKDATGRIETMCQTYTITKNKWSFKEILPGTTKQKLGETVEFSAEVSGNTKGLQYKFVWMRNNWEKWGVIKEFSTENSGIYLPDKLGEYTVYINIKDQEGTIETKSKAYTVKRNVWNLESINTDIESPKENDGKAITISAKTSGDKEGLQYKFVWMKDNWNKWGVIREFSENNVAEWIPKERGKYTLYVNVKDQAGEIVTKELSYEIVKIKWDYEAVVTDPANEQKKQKDVEIQAVTTGNTQGLQYKFVWMKDNWKDWGVIQEFTEENKAIWKTPNRSGQYKLYVNVKDLDNEIQTKELDYFVASQIWEPSQININDDVEEQVYRNIPITAIATGEIENLQFKFMWEKDGQTGVIRDFSMSNCTDAWFPKEAGRYTISVDIKDIDGNKKTIEKKYNVLPTPWKLEQIDIHGSSDRFVGNTVNVTAVTSGKKENLQYKFVRRRGDDWSDWEVIQEFDGNSSVEIALPKDGNYTIYVNIKDEQGTIYDAESTIIRSHKYISAEASETLIGKGKSVKLHPNVTGETGEMQFKYVWMKNNWEEWDVIKEFSTSRSVNWTPPTAGNYTVYINAKANDEIQTKVVKIEVTNAKNGWYYEGGYKFFYKDGVKQLDLDGILPKQSSYYIKVNRKACTVTVYAKDGENGYIIPAKRFACSVGLPATPTPTGTFYTPARYRWHELMGPSYGQYCTRITGSILFHSVAGRNKTSYNLNARDYNKLGQPASHGCVRLCVRDAKWIYDNCPLKTKVTIYDSSISGPLGKPATIKIPAGQTWDPTDPNI